MARKAGAAVEAARVCCERCPGATQATTRHIAKRRLLKAAIFQPQQSAQAAFQPPGSPWSPGSLGATVRPGVGRLLGSTSGRPGSAADAADRSERGGTGEHDDRSERGGTGEHADRAQRGGTGEPADRAERTEPGERARPADRANSLGGSARPGREADVVPANLYRAVTGQIVDIGPQVIVIGREGGERRFVLTAEATAWRGGPLDPAALSVGDEAVIRLLPSRAGVADRIWANIGRLTGTIMIRDGDRLVVAEGSLKKLQTVIIPAHSRVKIQVRFPTLEPGYLVDIIGIRYRDHLEGLHPATPQPNYRSDLVPKERQATGRLPETINGSATWHDSADEPYGVLGVSYPAIDPSAGCLEDATAGFGPGEAPAFRDLPYLAIGTALSVRNECTGMSWTLPVTGCAPIARMFNDRCVACQNSSRGRVADLTLASFVALGGELEAGCFNATLTIGR